MHINDERKMLKVVFISLVLFLVIFFSFLYFLNSQNRSYSNVGKSIYIGDEYKYIKYKDKLELEKELLDFYSKTNIKLLFYVIKNKKQLDSNVSFQSYKKVLKNEVKFFLTSVNSDTFIFYNDKIISFINEGELNSFISNTIKVQLKSDLFDTAIVDIIEYFRSKKLKLKIK